MTSRQRAVRQIVSLGVKYAPIAYQGLMQGKGPVSRLAEREVSRRGARTMATEHAAHLVDGSVLPVYDGDRRVWVVFSGDVPVATHPVVSTPMEQLLAHYDLAKRVPVAPPRRVRRKALPRPSTRTSASDPSAPGGSTA